MNSQYRRTGYFTRFLVGCGAGSLGSRLGVWCMALQITRLNAGASLIKTTMNRRLQSMRTALRFTGVAKIYTLPNPSPFQVGFSEPFQGTFMKCAIPPESIYIGAKLSINV
jgi:hypothetical protein